MASAKFLEEALSTDVDESAVNAIVGSLETQLVTSTPAAPGHQAVTAVVSQQNHQLNSGISNGGTIPTAIQKHGVANGGGSTSVNSLMTQEVSKTITTTTLLPVVTSNAVASAQVTTQHSQTTVATAPVGAGLPAYINQVNANASNVSIPKSVQEPVKLNYAPAAQVIASTGIVNVNNKLSFPAQTVAQLANGTLGVTQTQPVFQTTSNVVTNVTQTTQAVTSVNKPTGTALVIKTTATPGGMVSVPMSVPVSVAGNAVSTTMQAKAGLSSTIVPSNVQILNLNTMRPGTPVSGQQLAKQVPQRVVLGHNIMNPRPGASAITLQALSGLQSGAQGHLILKTENGQYQLLRVGPAPTVAAPTANAVAPNSIGNTVVAPPATAYRIASVPAVSRLNAQFTGPPLTTIRKPVQTVTATAALTTVTPSSTVAAPAVAAAPATVTPPTTTAQAGSTCAQRQTADNTKEKCRKFLANLLELSSREPRAVERNVRTLIQELIDTKVEPEEFCDRLEKLLNASPQPCLIGFLRRSLPLLRQSLVTKELVIDGIKPPPVNVVFSIASATPTVQQNQQIRPTIAATTSVPVVVSSTPPPPPPPIRVMAPPVAASPTVAPRASYAMQQRMVRPGAALVRPPAPTAIKSSVAVTSVRTPTPNLHKAPIMATAAVRSVATSAQGKTVNTATAINKTIVPSLVTKPTAKEKEKKTFSSAGYTGDDDINDVAAMGGVNLAEESQRILGSTEFVGTQIRSCKDEVFLHVSPLQQRIKQIVSNYGLEEPNQEVAALISHATQERLKNLVEKLAIIAEHRIDFSKVDPRYEPTQDVRAQLKFLEELDRVERRRHEEQEREVLMKAAKSRAKTEDPEQAKLKAKAKEMQRAEMEELRTREANLTALQAIGPRKKPRLDLAGAANSAGGSANPNTSATGMTRPVPMRPRLKRVNFRDLMFLLEQEKETCRSTMLYKSYLK